MAGCSTPGPLVSVIIPTFNRAHCVGRAIDSARTQTHQNPEIIVLDDGSTDDTRGLVARSYASDPRVRYFFHENRGVTATRNRGISLCRGDFVALLDSDDTWYSWKIELQLACLRDHSEIGMVWTDMEAIDPAGELVSRSYLRTMYSAYDWFPRNEHLFPQSFALGEIVPRLGPVVGGRRLYTGQIFSQMIMGNLVHTSTVLLRRERLEKVRGFNEEFRISGEDYDFHLRTCREGPVGFIDAATISYRTGMPDRLSGDVYKTHIAVNCLKTVRPWIEEQRSEIKLSNRMIRLRLAEIYAWVGDVLLNAGEASQARLHLYQAVRHQPWRLGAWKILALASLPGNLRHHLRAAVRALKVRFRTHKKESIAAAEVG
jgi:glycosyltransferase involved in cell wall biosynthesis